MAMSLKSGFYTLSEILDMPEDAREQLRKSVEDDIKALRQKLEKAENLLKSLRDYSDDTIPVSSEGNPAERFKYISRDDAVLQVLRDFHRPAHYEQITEELIRGGLRTDKSAEELKGSIAAVLSSLTKAGKVTRLRRGLYQLANTDIYSVNVVGNGNGQH